MYMNDVIAILIKFHYDGPLIFTMAKSNNNTLTITASKI